MNLNMTALSNIHGLRTTPPATYLPAPSCFQAGRQVDSMGRTKMLLVGGGGGMILIQRLLYLERGEGEGASSIFLTRLTLDQSHHTFSQGTFFFFTFSPPLSFSLHCILSFIFILLRQKKKKKKTRSTKVVLPAVIRERRGYR